MSQLRLTCADCNQLEEDETNCGIPLDAIKRLLPEPATNETNCVIAADRLALMSTHRRNPPIGVRLAELNGGLESDNRISLS